MPRPARVRRNAISPLWWLRNIVAGRGVGGVEGVCRLDEQPHAPSASRSLAAPGRRRAGSLPQRMRAVIAAIICRRSGGMHLEIVAREQPRAGLVDVVGVIGRWSSAISATFASSEAKAPNSNRQTCCRRQCARHRLVAIASNRWAVRVGQGPLCLNDASTSDSPR